MVSIIETIFLTINPLLDHSLLQILTATSIPDIFASRKLMNSYAISISILLHALLSISVQEFTTFTIQQWPDAHVHTYRTCQNHNSCYEINAPVSLSTKFPRRNTARGEKSFQLLSENLSGGKGEPACYGRCLIYLSQFQPIVLLSRI